MSSSLVTSILGWVDVNDHVEYVIKVALAGKERSWQVQRRYRRFFELHTRLRPYYGDALPPFPETRLFGMGKLFFGSQSSTFVSDRAAALQRYLEGVLGLEPNAAPPILRQFLGVDPARAAELDRLLLRPANVAVPSSQKTHWLLKDGGQLRGLGKLLRGNRTGAVARPEPLEYSTLEVDEVAVAVAAAAGAVAAHRLRAASPAAAEGLRRILPKLTEKRWLLVCGGSSSYAQDFAQRFCPATGTWEQLPATRLPRRACAAASVEGRCFVAGGIDALAVNAADSGITPEHVSDNWCEYFDPVSGGWELLQPSGPPYTHAAAAACGGFVYVFGGLGGGGALNSASRLDPAKLRWQPLKPLPTPRFECAAASFSGQICVVGGASSSGEPLAVVECFDPSVGKWTPGMPNMGTARFGCAAAAAVGKVFVVGGHCRGESLADVECFDPRLERWEALTPLPAARHRCGAAATAGAVYVFGGTDGQQELASVERLDARTGRWEAVGSMPRACGRCCATALAS